MKNNTKNNVSDSQLSAYLENRQSPQEMIEVERSLVATGDADLLFHLLMSEYEAQKEQADALLGPDEEEPTLRIVHRCKHMDSGVLNIENLAAKMPRRKKDTEKMQENDTSTLYMDEDTTVKNKISMKPITQATAERIAHTVEQLREFASQEENAALSERDVMAAFFQQNFPGRQDAAEVAGKIIHGITNFSDKFHVAMTQDECRYADMMLKEMPDATIEQKYNVMLNLLVALQATNQDILESLSNQPTQAEALFEEIKSSHYTATGEVTEQMYNELKEKLEEQIANSSLCVAGNANISDLIHELPQNANAAVSFVSDTLDEVRLKQYTAMATYIEYVEGNIPEYAAGMDPEMIAVGVAAGVEQDKVMEDVKTGRTTREKAVRILKIIGAVAIICALIMLSLYIAMGTIMVTMGLFMSLFGTSLLAILLGGIAGAYLGYKLGTIITDSIEICLETAEKVFDSVTSFFVEKALPWIREKTMGIRNWIADLFQRNQIRRTEEVAATQRSSICISRY